MRQVFYLPGFDPREPEAYWGLLRREGRLTASRRGLTIDVGEPVRSADGFSLDWMVESLEHGVATRSRYGLLRWDDIVRSRFPRSNLRRLIDIPRLWWRLWRCGYLEAFRREAWQFSAVILVVHLLYVGLVIASLGLAAALVAMMPLGEGSAFLRWTLLLPAAYGILSIVSRITKGRPFFITHLVDDTAFTHEHASGDDHDMRARLDAWAERIHAAESEAAEIVVIGHSSSSFLALEALDRVLMRDPRFGERGVPVTLVTLGSVIPWITLDPLAEGTRASLRRLADAEAIAWLDLRAPWDWLSIHLRSPVAAVDPAMAKPDRPMIRSISIADLIEPSTVATLRWNFFRMHFQLLMSSRDRTAFDYIALISGAEPVHRAVEAIEDSPFYGATAPPPAA
ncbi:hydrolase [Methylobacterium brachythecii]|uniref:hydrolase n=1 Tax=Methylobacterium brachythecii TaxID=1176177 RepID=UPI0016092CD2|nr:hydrolase [Methylobacterium brachythecii]